MLSLASIRKPLGHKTSQFLYNNQSAKGRNYLKIQLAKKKKKMLAYWHQNNRLREQEVSSQGAVVNQEAALTLGKE